MIDRCRRGAVIHVGLIPARCFRIGCGKPANSSAQTHKERDNSRVQRLPKQQLVFPAALHHYVHFPVLLERAAMATRGWGARGAAPAS